MGASISNEAYFLLGGSTLTASATFVTHLVFDKQLDCGENAEQRPDMPLLLSGLRAGTLGKRDFQGFANRKFGEGGLVRG